MLLRCQSLGTPSLPSTPTYQAKRNVLSEARGSLYDEKEAFAKEDAGCGAGWIQTCGLPCPGGRGPGFRLRAGLRLGIPMPLTEGFDAAAEQLLHCTALVQV